MAARKIEVLPYDPAWSRAFEDIKAELSDALGGLSLRIEHVGSTSVKGLSAKPIIDIDVVIADRSVLGEVIKALGSIGYYHEGDLGITGREAFGYEGKEHLMPHHLYVCAEGSSELKRHLAFRDWLRSHPEDVREYSRVKEEAAKLYPNDIDGYIKHKSPFIERIYNEIKKEDNQMEDCLFCKIIAGEIPSAKVYEDELCFAFKDIAPTAPTHILVIPKEHISKLDEITPENSAVIAHIYEVIAKLAKELDLKDGFRVVSNCGESAGQSVFHIHFHLLAGRPFAWPAG